MLATFFRRYVLLFSSSFPLVFPDLPAYLHDYDVGLGDGLLNMRKCRYGPCPHRYPQVVYRNDATK